jgi:TonB family protein
MNPRLDVLTLACLLLAAQPRVGAAQNRSSGPGADDLISARLAWGADPTKRCPDLQQAAAPEGTVAVVQFRVGPTGVPSQASIRTSSGSAGFDAAAMSCVLKLHFLPATRFGDGVAVESRQQIALKSAGPASAPQAARCDPAGTAQASGAVQNTVVVADAQEASDGKREPPGPATARAGVCVCVDETGKLTQTPVLTNSSGIPGFDKAALELSAAAHYRPAISASGQPAPGCFRFKVGLEVK